MKINNLISQFKSGLDKSRKELLGKLELLFNKSHNKADFIEKLEELLILSDVGVSATQEILNEFKQMDFSEYKEKDFIYFKEKLAEILINILKDNPTGINIDREKLNIIMLVGVNGSGKTSVAGKIAYLLKKENHRILMVPADTFRAAAIQQLKILSDQAGVEMINTQEGADPAAVVYDGINAAYARKKEVVIIDTAGRLHTKTNLMKELEKIIRVIKKEAKEYSLEILQVIDATMGQNVISQVSLFHKTLGVTGLVLTKMDGTAKGGIVIALKKELNIPVKFVSWGEKLSNLYYFEAPTFVQALLD